MSDGNEVIIVRRKITHGGHHGGAWKVAYADFVTAMMALFIVLWLMNASKQVQEAVGGYFKDPTGTSKMVGNGQKGSGDAITLTKDDMNKIKDAMLLIHGAEDSNSGTFPIQSERMFQAIKGLGGTARLVMLPNESHAYRARESIMHMLYETNAWLDKYVKNAELS